MSNKPDFSLLVAAAYPPSGEVNTDALPALWRALFELPEWCMLVHPSRIAEGEPPHPYVAPVQGSGVALVFTSPSNAQTWAKENGLVGEDGKAFLLQLDPMTVRRWLDGLASARNAFNRPLLSQVRFDDGSHGWFAPPGQVEVIAMHLGLPSLIASSAANR